MEAGYRPAIMLSIGLEAATIVLLGAHLGLRAAPGEPHGPGPRPYAHPNP